MAVEEIGAALGLQGTGRRAECSHLGYKMSGCSRKQVMPIKNTLMPCFKKSKLT